MPANCTRCVLPLPAGFPQPFARYRDGAELPKSQVGLVSSSCSLWESFWGSQEPGRLVATQSWLLRLNVPPPGYAQPAVNIWSLPLKQLALCFSQWMELSHQPQVSCLCHWVSSPACCGTPESRVSLVEDVLSSPQG